MSATLLLSVAAGGAIGAVLRHLLMIVVNDLVDSQFPFATLTVNVVGAFILGSAIGAMAYAWSPSEAMKAFLTVGLLGGFTTFSLFSMDMFNLVVKGSVIEAGVYAVASVFLCVLGFTGGMALLRHALA
jgi:fluoride exporter